MGMNPAVHFANLYLFTYELEFMQRLILTYASADSTAARKRSALKFMSTFRFSCRYIDDLFVIAPPSVSADFIERFLYVDQVHEGIAGIYPSSLWVASTTQPLGITAKYMDIYAFLAFGSSGPIVTGLYDKRREPRFQVEGNQVAAHEHLFVRVMQVEHF